MVEGTQARNSNSSSGFMDGLRFAGLTRMECKRWLAQAELAYANNIGENVTVIVIDNTQNPANSASADSWLIGEMPLFS